MMVVDHHCVTGGDKRCVAGRRGGGGRDEGPHS